MPLAAPALLQHLHQASGAASAHHALRLQPVDEQGEGDLPPGKDMVDEPRGDPWDLESDIDHRAGQRGDRDPAATGAVNGLEEAGPVHHETIEYRFPALRDRDLEPGFDVREAPEHAGRAMRRNAVGGKAPRHLRLFPCPRCAHAPNHPLVDGFPVVASGHPAPLAGRYARFQCLMASDETMLSSGKIP